MIEPPRLARQPIEVREARGARAGALAEHRVGGDRHRRHRRAARALVDRHRVVGEPRPRPELAPPLRRRLAARRQDQRARPELRHREHADQGLSRAAWQHDHTVTGRPKRLHRGGLVGVRREAVPLDRHAERRAIDQPRDVLDRVPHREQAALERAAMRDRHQQVVARGAGSAPRAWARASDGAGPPRSGRATPASPGPDRRPAGTRRGAPSDRGSRARRAPAARTG